MKNFLFNLEELLKKKEELTLALSTSFEKDNDSVVFFAGCSGCNNNCNDFCKGNCTGIFG